MPLTEEHRNEIYRHLVPQWGEEVTEGFLSQFPATEGEQPVSRDFVRAELAELRGDLHGLVVKATGLVLGAIGVATTIVGVAAA